MSLAGMMRSTCTITRPSTATKDSSGGKTDGAPVAVATNEPCDLQPASSSVVFRYRQMQMDITHSCFVTRDVGARQNDKVTIGARVFTVAKQGYEPPAAGYGEWPGVMHLNEQPAVT